MTQVWQNRRTRITPPSEEVRADFSLGNQQREALGMRCRAVFERLRPTLMETHYNWHIAIDADTEQYLIDHAGGLRLCSSGFNRRNRY